MKLSMRILMGILFPFILILTVTTISKALKPEKTRVNTVIPSEISQKTTDSAPVLLTTHKEN